jgi:hypothetical protein
MSPAVRAVSGVARRVAQSSITWSPAARWNTVAGRILCESRRQGPIRPVRYSRDPFIAPIVRPIIAPAAACVNVDDGDGIHVRCNHPRPRHEATAFTKLAESETQPSNTSVESSDASWLLRGSPLPIGSLMQSARSTHR